jgi:putative flippase GtrA
MFCTEVSSVFTYACNALTAYESRYRKSCVSCQQCFTTYHCVCYHHVCALCFIRFHIVNNLANMCLLMCRVCLT